MIDEYLSPVEKHLDIYIKRDDMFRLDGYKSNGTKLREGLALIEANLDYCKKYGVITACGLNSPQAVIVASICDYYKISCTVCYGGTNEVSALKKINPRIAKQYGATLNFECKCARHNSMYSYVKKRVEKTKEFIVKYGIDLISEQMLTERVGCQVENIPDCIEEMHFVCGSGVTAIGLLLGLQKYNKQNIKRIYLYSNAPDRSNKITKYFEGKNNDYLEKITFVDLFHQQGFQYDKKQYYNFDGIQLHPNYEAKAFKYMVENKLYKPDKSLFYIIGSYIDDEL